MSTRGRWMLCAVPSAALAAALGVNSLFYSGGEPFRTVEEALVCASECLLFLFALALPMCALYTFVYERFVEHSEGQRIVSYRGIVAASWMSVPLTLLQSLVVLRSPGVDILTGAPAWINSPFLTLLYAVAWVGPAAGIWLAARWIKATQRTPTFEQASGL